MTRPEILQIGPLAVNARLQRVEPHHASGTVETRKAMGQLVRDNLAAHFAGQDLPTPVL
ncbi:MAG: hypothetical protein AAF844_19300 [Pseudomonadota bacterium]